MVAAIRNAATALGLRRRKLRPTYSIQLPPYALTK